MSQNLAHILSRHPNRSLVTLPSDSRISQCVNTMFEMNIGAIVIQDEERTIGVISERDITRKLVAKGLDPDTTLAQDIVYADVAILKSDSPVEKAMEVMGKQQRRHILVKEEDTLLGIISIGDIMAMLLQEKQFEIEQLENYIHS